MTMIKDYGGLQSNQLDRKVKNVRPAKPKAKSFLLGNVANVV